jgi:hypothetical protein
LHSAFFQCSLKTLVYEEQDLHSLLDSKHLDEPIDFITQKTIALCSLKSGLHEPTKPVWGDQYSFSTVAVEHRRELSKGKLKSKSSSTWSYYLGFGHRYLRDASIEDDGIVYYCVGFTSKINCQRLRFMIAYLALSSTADKKLSAKTIHEIQTTPIRMFHISAVIPGTILPRVVGNILQADPGTRSNFFDAVTSLFSVGAKLPFYYKVDKHEKDVCLLIFLHHAYALLGYSKSSLRIQDGIFQTPISLFRR